MIDLAPALTALRAGEVIGVPTDTVYGLAADPQDPQAMQRLFELKGRPARKPVGLLVASVDQAQELVMIKGFAADLVAAHWPGPLTIVAKPRVVLPNWVGHRITRAVGVRVPDHAVTLELLAAFGPLAVTSANRSGGEEALTDIAARAIFDGEVAHWVAGASPGGEASTVVDVTGRKPVVLRPGPIRL